MGIPIVWKFVLGNDFRPFCQAHWVFVCTKSLLAWMFTKFFMFFSGTCEMPNNVFLRYLQVQRGGPLTYFFLAVMAVLRTLHLSRDKRTVFMWWRLWVALILRRIGECSYLLLITIVILLLFFFKNLFYCISELWNSKIPEFQNGQPSTAAWWTDGAGMTWKI